MVNKIKAGLYSIGIILWFMGTQFLTALLFVLFGQEDRQFLMMAWSYTICLGPFVYYHSKFKKDSLLDFIMPSIKEIIRYMSWGILLWLGTSVLNAFLLPFFSEYTEQINSLFLSPEPLFRFLVLVIGAPLVEEYLFRGKMQSLLQKGFGDRLGVIFQGLLFGLIHPFGMQKIYASVLGISFGFVKEYTQNLVAPVIMHMTINGIGWILSIAIQ